MSFVAVAAGGGVSGAGEKGTSEEVKKWRGGRHEKVLSRQPSRAIEDPDRVLRDPDHK